MQTQAKIAEHANTLPGDMTILTLSSTRNWQFQFTYEESNQISYLMFTVSYLCYIPITEYLCQATNILNACLFKN
jgi:hypothetical protein